MGIKSPKTVDYNINGVCNLDCPWCWGPMHSHLIETLTLCDWKNLTDNLKEKGTENIVISGGEPLLKKGLKEIITHIKDNEMKVTLSTNGILLHKHLGLLEYVDDLGIPIDGHSPETSEIMRKRSGKFFGKTLNNIKMAQEQFPQIDYTIRTVVSERNKNQIDLIGILLSDHGLLGKNVRRKIYECTSYGPRRDEILGGNWQLNLGEFDLIQDKISQLFPETNLKFQKEESSIGRYMIVNPNGDIKVVQAKGFESIVGNISNLDEILINQKFVNNENHG